MATDGRSRFSYGSTDIYHFKGTSAFSDGASESESKRSTLTIPEPPFLGVQRSPRALPHQGAEGVTHI